MHATVAQLYIRTRAIARHSSSNTQAHKIRRRRGKEGKKKERKSTEIGMQEEAPVYIYAQIHTHTHILYW